MVLVQRLVWRWHVLEHDMYGNPCHYAEFPHCVWVEQPPDFDPTDYGGNNNNNNNNDNSNDKKDDNDDNDNKDKVDDKAGDA